MELTFLGAAGEVTGSCHLLEVGGRRVLLDCGMIQGGREAEARNAEPFPFDPASIDAVILSHAHIDHSGRLPQLVRHGFTGRIHTHAATRDLARVMLRDAAFLEEKDAEHESRRRARRGQEGVEPAFTRADATAAVRRIHAHQYGQPHEVVPGVTLTLHDAGHILGSATVEVELTEGETRRRVVFSGDLGHRGAPILRDPEPLERADLVLLESTYGGRNHRDWDATWEELAGILERARHDRGNVLIPAFAVGRTQELLYVLDRHYAEWGVDRWQLFLDSPMAIEATEIYARHWKLYDETARQWRGQQANPFRLPNLHFSRTANQSRAINRIHSGAMVIAGSGMCSGGRILHHFKHHLWRRETEVLITGFQARGTPGRALVDGAQEIKVWGEPIRVGAKVHTIGGLSAHADSNGLVEWYGHFRGRPPVALVHGEAEQRDALAERLAGEYGAPVLTPGLGERMDLADPDRLLPAG